MKFEIMKTGITRQQLLLKMGGLRKGNRGPSSILIKHMHCFLNINSIAL